MKQTLAIVGITLLIGGAFAISFIVYYEYNKPQNVKARQLKKEQFEKEKQEELIQQQQELIQQQRIAKEEEQKRIQDQQEQELIVKVQQELEAKKRVEEKKIKNTAPLPKSTANKLLPFPI